MARTTRQKSSAAALEPAQAVTEYPVELDTTTPVIKESLKEERATPNQPRKRRRSPSPNLVLGTEPEHKRSTLRKAPSPIIKRTPATDTNNSAFRGIVENDGLPPECSILQQTDGPGSPSTSGHANNPIGPHPDMHAVINKIIDHGESVDIQYAARNDNVAGLANPDSILGLGASSQLKVQSLPILENLAVQILTTFANAPYQEILALTSESDSEPGAAYSTLKSLFDHTKKVYSIRDPFLSPRGLGFIEQQQIDTIRKANLATFVSSVFGSQDVGFYHLNEAFLDTFLVDGSRLLKNQAGLFLDLKTQAYISAISNGDRSREDILEDLFPHDLEQHLLKRRSGARQLAPGEADFIQRANNRKKTLLEEPTTPDSIAQLPVKYLWEDFLRDISSYVTKSFSSIVGSMGTKTPMQNRSTNLFESEQSQQNKRQGPRKPLQEKAAKGPDTVPPPTNTFTPRVAQMVPPDTDDIAEKAARAAEFAMQDFSVSQDSAGPSHGNSQDHPQPQTPQYPFQFEQQPTPYYTQNQISSSQQLSSQLAQEHQHQQQPPQPQPQQQAVNISQAQNVYVDPAPVPYPTQSAPTSVLYERARMAATAKASPSNRRAGHPSQRRPWTQEEENALMSGLDHVKGPHWSQILAMYGPGGTLNETLKDRNQVQLKDKARNLKLFFLKSGIEVPYYLQFVTGELKTRAPQVARQELQREMAAKQEQAAAGALAGSEVNEEEVLGMAEDQEANMEDGEGEIIDPAEYAAVHGAGSRDIGAGQDDHGLNPPDAQQQLYDAATGQTMSISDPIVSELTPVYTNPPTFGLTSAPFLTSTFHQFKTSASNSSSAFNSSRFLDSIPRWLAPLTDGLSWLQSGGGFVAEATDERAVIMETAAQASTRVDAAAVSAAAGNTVTEAASTSAFRQALTFHHIRNFGGIFTYMTSKWALACFILAIVLNRTKIYTSGRRNLRLTFALRFALRIGPILMFLSHIQSLLEAIRCQTSPDYSRLKYGDPSKHFDLDFARDGGLLYRLSSTLLFWQGDKESCEAVEMVRPMSGFRGSLSLLWPLFKTLCVGQFVEVFSCAVQGRPPMTETGMSVFEHSLAFAEAEAMLSNHLGLSLFGFPKSTVTTTTTNGQGSSSETAPLTRNVLFEKLNTPPEVLLMGLISCLNNLSSHLLALFNLQSQFRLVNTGIWGLCFMASFVWGFFGFKQSTGAEAIVLRFPTVCIVGFIPHLLVLIGILGCACIYFIALTLAVLSPPVGLPRPRSWMERLEVAHANLQANAHLSTIRLSMHEDFYTALLKVGFTTLTIASEAVFLNEGKRIGVHRWTWLEEERLKEIQETTEFARERLNNQSSSTVAGGVAMTETRSTSGLIRWRSGYARERTSKSLKVVPATSARVEAGGVGASQRSGRYMGAWELLSGIFWLVTGWIALLSLRLLRRAGFKRVPSWMKVKHSKDCSKRQEDKQHSQPPSQSQTLEFWMLSDDGNLSLPENDNVDVEAETKKRLALASDSWGAREEQHLESTLYNWWAHGGWWGERDNSGDYTDPDINDDLTSEISISESRTDDQGWESDDGNNDDGRTTPTQKYPYPINDSRETTPFPDYSLDPTELACMLNPQNIEQRREAHMLAQHLSSDRIVTRSQFRQSQGHSRTQLLTSSPFNRPPDFRPSNENGRLTPAEEAEILEYLILSKRSRPDTTTSLSPPSSPSDPKDQSSKDSRSWRDGAAGLGAGGPQCVVCQCAPRT
ncbi:MAG: hypothetical protein Q9181_004184, partial [Wetmoreana brouardii]